MEDLYREGDKSLYQGDPDNGFDYAVDADEKTLSISPQVRPENGW